VLLAIDADRVHADLAVDGKGCPRWCVWGWELIGPNRGHGHLLGVGGWRARERGLLSIATLGKLCL